MNFKRLIILMISLYLGFLVFTNVAHAVNDLSVNRQWVIDETADNLAPQSLRLYIKSIIWFPSAADDDLLITDALGTKIIVKARAMCAAANGETFCVEIWTDADLPDNIKGMDIGTIDGGVVYINFKKR